MTTGSESRAHAAFVEDAGVQVGDMTELFRYGRDPVYRAKIDSEIQAWRDQQNARMTAGIAAYRARTGHGRLDDNTAAEAANSEFVA